ncbi:GNAT family N-acetyltransferase [Serratia marcescens]|uniref:GNAT family N-acetyltransferase n=1 Tax=Serratia marcescens TaxID=615 RepID=UPI001D125220|nr:N-acetyltransferase [Serratia marcescens]
MAHRSARVRLAGHTQQRHRRLVRAGAGVVLPASQNRGIGSRLIRQLLAELQERHAAGCVVLGDPNYYGRFGFQAQTALTLPGVPQDYFRAIAFQGALPCAEVAFHNAFNAES